MELKISDLKKAFDRFSNEPIKKTEYTLVFSRDTWEGQALKTIGYDFSKEELDCAEKLDIKFIGIRRGVKCYLLDIFL